jgi:hypothetical protein
VAWIKSDKVYQMLVHGRWFSLGTPTSSTTKTGRHDIAEILLRVTLTTKNQIKLTLSFTWGFFCFDQARWCSVGKIQANRRHVRFSEFCQIAHMQNYRE